MINDIGKKGIVIGIVLLFACTSLASGIENNVISTNQKAIVPGLTTNKPMNAVPITLAVYGKPRAGTQTTIVSSEDADKISLLFKELKTSIVSSPFDDRTQQLKEEFITLLAQCHLIPAGVSPDQYSALLNPPWFEKLRKNHHTLTSSPLKTQAAAGTAAALFCSISGEGLGVLFPFIMLPRPRIINTWSALDGVTIAGKLLTIGGFAAGGAQLGFNIGFWGIGLAYATPYGTLYGFIGYSLFSSVTAQAIERYPPDYAPVIIATEPADGALDVPVSLSELRFSIEDPSGDLMSYHVTTSPDIGSGNGNLKPAGTYAIPVQGLEDLTKYSWTIKVSDDVQTVEKTLTFTTEAVAPIVSNPSPEDNERDVPMNLPVLQFTLKDYQGDVMEYTVQTSPNIGSAHETGVHDGTYNVPISGMTYGGVYHWYLNATDGTHWTRKTYSFTTGYPSPFDPFDFGWLYRKQIIIDHTQVTDDLENFPVLIVTTDADLMKAQDDGDDLLFMNGAGAAVKLHHEIETFDGSTGALVAWVNISDLSSSEDTIFYLYYGNPDSINQEYPEKTWDSHYKGVWHMNDATPSTVADSTSNGITGMKKAANTPQEGIGKIGNGQQFDRTETLWEYIAMNDFNTLSFPGDFTLSAWINPLTTQNMKVAGKHQEISGDYKGYSINWNVGSTAKMSLRVDGGGYRYQYIYADEEKPPGNWYYLSGMKQAGTNYFYVDGVQQTKTGTQALVNSENPFCIGAWETDSESANFHGTIDEVRVSDIGRSSAWIATEYHNMNTPTLFFSIGPEEPHP